MFTSMSALSSSSASSISTYTFSVSQKESTEEKIPWLAEGEAEKKLAITLAQIQRNEIKQLNLSLENFGRFYGQTEPSYTLSGHQNWVRSLAVLPNGQLASGSHDKDIKLWDLSSHSCLSTLRGHIWYVLALAVLPNGLLASGSYDNTIKLWDLASYTCLSTLSGHISSVLALAVLPNGQLVSGSLDKTIKLWNIASHSCLATLQGHKQGVSALTVLPNGKVASGSYDKNIKLWDLASRSCLATLEGHTGLVLALAAFPNGQLASGSSDHTIKLWDVATHSCLATLQGHGQDVSALAVLPDGLLASGSHDKTIKLWNLASHSCLATLQGHTGWVNALAVLPNGQLTSGAGDNTLRLWNPTIISLSAQTLQPILKALQTNTSVTDLNLSGNPQVADDIIDSLVDLFKPQTASNFKPNTTLETLDLRQTSVTSAGIEKLQKILRAQSLSVTVLSDKIPEPKAARERSAEEEAKACQARPDQGTSHASKEKESLELEIKWVQAVKACHPSEGGTHLLQDKKLMEKASEEHKSPLSFALEQKSLEMARSAINCLGKSIQEIPELKIMSRMELFRKAAHQLGSEGAKLIGDALEIKPSAYQTELWWGVQHRDAALVQAALELKADPADLNKQGLRLIHVAAEIGDEKVISVLAHYGQIDNVDAKGHTALHRAILKDPSNPVKLLTAHKDEADHMPSIKTVRTEPTQPEAVAILLKAKANVEAVDAANGNTPLHIAAEKGLEAIVKLLIEAGANPEVKNHAHLKPLQLAKNAHRANVVEFLRTKSIERRIRPFLDSQLQPLQKQIAEQQHLIAEQKSEIERLKQALAKAQASMSQGLKHETVIGTASVPASPSPGFWSLSASPSPKPRSTESSPVILTRDIPS